MQDSARAGQASRDGRERPAPSPGRPAAGPLPAAAVRGMAGGGAGRRAGHRMRSRGSVPAPCRRRRASRVRHRGAGGLAGPRPAPGLRPARVGGCRLLRRVGEHRRRARPARHVPGAVRAPGHCRAGTPARGQPARPRRLAGDAPRPPGQPRPRAGGHPSGRRPGTHPGRGVPAGLRHPRDHDLGGPAGRQRRHHRRADPLRRPVAGQRRPVLLRSAP